MSKRWMFETTPIELVATKRKELSEVLRNGLRLDAEDKYWLGVWIHEFDKAIQAIDAIPSNELLGGEMICPKCGRECGRDEVHNGVCMLYGPWGCSCGWSEDERYRHNPDTRYDSRGGFTPNPRGQPPPNGGRLDGVVGTPNQKGEE